MDLLCRRRSQKLILTGKVLFLTISLGFAVPAIMTTPIMTLLIPHTQVTPMVTKGSTNNNAEGTIEWTQTFVGLYKNVGSWMEQTADGGYIITGKTLSSDAE
ncbi:MAG: hypothetical protein ACFFCW_40920, partial [Candidatus Hodarchaeota archaeon]